MPALDDRSLQFTITEIHTLAIIILEKQPDYRIQQFLYVMYNILKNNKYDIYPNLSTIFAWSTTLNPK